MTIRLILALIVGLGVIAVGIALGRVTTIILGVALVATVFITCFRPGHAPPGGGRILDSESPHRWLLDAVRYFRQLGFFSVDKHLSDGDLAEKLERAHQEEWGQTFDPSDPLSDLALLRYDQDRVWWEDTEADVCDGNDVYVQVLGAWSRISRGVFMPTGATEHWKSEEGPIRVRFESGGVRSELEPQYLQDYIDTSILKTINAILRPTGYAFQVYKPFDQTAFVVILTDGERDKLVADRKWEFEG